MKTPVFTLTLALSLLTGSALAQAPASPKAQYATDSKKALARYEEDKKLCNDETSSSTRLQCRRDAKAEYDQARAAAKAEMTAATQAGNAKPVVAKALCADCGKVLAVTMTEKEGEGGAVGMIAGGVTGAILGHQVGGGLGKDLATIAGAAGGAYAGKKIEEKVRTHKVWTVSVQYGDGRKSAFNFEKEPGLKVGDPVKNSGNSVVRY
nr:hypothetical protein [Rhodoferax sp.]